MILSADNISFAYNAGQAVVRDLTIELRPGEVTAVFGPNGCGKSTLLRCLNASLKPTSGCVRLDKQPILDLDRQFIARTIAVVPQDTPADVPFTVSEVVLLGRYPHSTGWNPSNEDLRIANDSLERMGLAHLAGRPFSQLSGGERQRVVIARALAQQTPILLLDEPALHLDIAHQLDLYRLMRDLAREGRAVMAICHDLILAPLFVDSAILMHNGCKIVEGSASMALDHANLQSVFGVRLAIDRESSSSVTVMLEPDS